MAYTGRVLKTHFQRAQLLLSDSSAFLDKHVSFISQMFIQFGICLIIHGKMINIRIGTNEYLKISKDYFLHLEHNEV